MFARRGSGFRWNTKKVILALCSNFKAKRYVFDRNGRQINKNLRKWVFHIVSYFPIIIPVAVHRTPHFLCGSEIISEKWENRRQYESEIFFAGCWTVIASLWFFSAKDGFTRTWFLNDVNLVIKASFLAKETFDRHKNVITLSVQLTHKKKIGLLTGYCWWWQYRLTCK